MTEKRVKAWAVVDVNGNIVTPVSAAFKSVYYAKKAQKRGERVVPVEIIIKEPK